MFRWGSATIEEMAKHISEIPAQQVTSLLSYYKKKGNTQMLTAISEARILARRYRAAKKIASLIEEYGLQGVEDVAESSEQCDAVGVGTQGE